MEDGLEIQNCGSSPVWPDGYFFVQHLDIHNNEGLPNSMKRFQNYANAELAGRNGQINL